MREGRKKKAGYYSKIIFFIVLCGTIWVWQRNTAIRLGYKVSEVKDRISALSEENKYLTMKIMDIMALDNLEIVAKKKLGLVAPKASDIIIIEEDKKEK